MGDVRLSSGFARELRRLEANAGTVSAVGLALVWGADQVFPRGYLVSPLYVPIVLLGALAAAPWISLLLAVEATVLAVTDWVTWHAEQDALAALANVVLITLSVWIVAIGVTRYRLAWQAQRRASRRLHEVRDALDEVVSVATTDPHGRIEFVNERFCALTKYRREDLIGQAPLILAPGGHDPDAYATLSQTIARGHIWHGELQGRARDGAVFTVDATVIPCLDESGATIRYMALGHDLTDRQAQERRYRDQAALAALGGMAAVVAHEVRNPLAGIRSGVQLIAADLSPGSGSASLGRDIVLRIDALNCVLEDLLTFARPRAVKALPVELLRFLNELIGAFRLDPKMARVTVHVGIQPMCVVQGDPDQLRLVFTNVLVNAAQAMNGEGDISITSDDGGDGTWAIHVADRGPGIPPELFERVFEPFYTTKHQGTGLGLPTVKRMVEAHNGSVALSRRPGGGTIVTVRLPVSRAVNPFRSQTEAFPA